MAYYDKVVSYRMVNGKILRLSAAGAAIFLSAATPSLAADAGNALQDSQNAGQSSKVSVQTVETSDTAEMQQPTPSVEPASPGKPNESAARLDEVYGWKGWDIPFPSYGDSLLQDYGGWRSSLADLGIGVADISEPVFAGNVLDRPRNSPTFNPHFETRQNYEGQALSSDVGVRLFVTYDLSRWSIPDGQFQIAGELNRTTYQGYAPNQAGFTTLAYYQTLFNRRLELRMGFYPASYDFVGQYIGGNFANTTGAGGSIPVLLGLPSAPATAPTARVTAHVTDALYDEFAAMRSAPVTGPSGNPFFDGIKQNPLGLDWSINSVPGTHELYINEIGYKEEAQPGIPKTWARLGLIYNTSDFQDFTKLLTPNGAEARKSDNSGMYFLVDRQLWQQEPDSANTAYRGLYGGFTAEYARPDETPVTQYYEGRAYWIGPFESRPQDMASVVLYHQINSPDLVDAVNKSSFETGAYGSHTSNSATLTYMFHVAPGLWASFGATYTDYPTPTYFGPSAINPHQAWEGDALNLESVLVAIL